MTAVVVRTGAAVALVASIALVAAGCGSQSPEEKWAGSVCSSLTTWQNEVKQATDDALAKVRSPQVGTVAAVQADVKTAVDATNTLTSSLKTIGPPNTPAGAEAKKQIDTFATQLHSTVATVQKTISGISTSASISDALKQLSTLGPELQSLATTTTSTVDAIQAGSTAMQEGFKKANSCKPYRR